MSRQRSNCPISCSLDIFGDKWSLLIIRDVMLRGKCSYSEFLKSEEKIATNILTSRLALLEEAEILSKEVAPENRSKFIYHLTQKGADLLPIIIELMDWGARYNDLCPRRELGKKIKKNKAAVIDEYRQRLKKQIR
ncbi:winged helix-turn-helix transcriptional regulator [Niabella drilacis]|uniref:Transcriptional regulator, HxlR family n=1 Tax=Niabella drilacis (strain DSM 25811 / CCM 8410 / CCUG 62505 / LMG 26954 / E90) TaxID=1285928 RepID=A0A1G6NB14_NIADE|nr:helix-turn-helix domain-containing protein [Niabella drilacis]SDC65022.1 transcriptional regulator, HxlR family [Niabella drilacis]